MDGSDDGADATGGLDELPLLGGVVAGAVAWVVGYVLTYLLRSEDVRGSSLTAILEFLSDDAAAWKVVGWLFYNAQFVDVIVPGFTGSRSVNLLAEAEGTAVLYAVPVLALVAAGLALARATGAGDLTAGAKHGSTLVLGYLPLILAGVFLFTVSVGDDAIRPDLIPAFFVAGVVYPGLFGAVGGAAWAALGGD